jgi:hypothetical protein
MVCPWLVQVMWDLVNPVARIIRSPTRIWLAGCAWRLKLSM